MSSSPHRYVWQPTTYSPSNFATLPPRFWCNNLMANANADHRHISGLGIANGIFARWNKTMIFIRTMPRFRNQSTIADVYRSKKIHINHFESFKRKPLACQKVTKNCIIVTKLCLNCILGVASQQKYQFSYVTV